GTPSARGGARRTPATGTSCSRTRAELDPPPRSVKSRAASGGSGRSRARSIARSCRKCSSSAPRARCSPPSRISPRASRCEGRRSSCTAALRFPPTTRTRAWVRGRTEPTPAYGPAATGWRCSGRTPGRLEWRDWSIHASGPVNVLRRASAPVSIVGGAEGVEVEPIRDPSLGRAPAPGRFDDAHDAPPVRTRLADGAPLEISWEHAALAWRGRVACCLAESGAFQRLQDEARRARGAWGAGAFLMAYDSIGIAGWDPACGASGETPGQLPA